MVYNQAKRHSPQESHQLVMLYNRGDSLRAIERATGLDYRTIIKRLRRLERCHITLDRRTG